MDDAEQTLSRLLIMYHEGICLECLARQTRLPSEWIANKIDEFRSVAPVKEYDDICPDCGVQRHLYSIHYPLP